MMAINWVECPLLAALQLLNDHEWQRAATQIGPGIDQWHGDLADGEVRAIYEVMRDQQKTLLQVTHYIAPGSKILLARLVTGQKGNLAVATAAKDLSYKRRAEISRELAALRAQNRRR
jgi:hypothetical protein